MDCAIHMYDPHAKRADPHVQEREARAPVCTIPQTPIPCTRTWTARSVLCTTPHTEHAHPYVQERGTQPLDCARHVAYRLQHHLCIEVLRECVAQAALHLLRAGHQVLVARCGAGLRHDDGRALGVELRPASAADHLLGSASRDNGGAGVRYGWGLDCDLLGVAPRREGRARGGANVARLVVGL
eukprot:365664-Chlamydomonas_euryale.AAC.11